MMHIKQIIKPQSRHYNFGKLFPNIVNSYHTYPDPKEEPKISSIVSNATKTLDKSRNDFALDSKFKFEIPFPGTNIPGEKSDTSPPQIVSSVLDNGLTVATQEVPGLMSSFTFLVKAGRYISNCFAFFFFICILCV
jgi:hypothetical protein